MALAYSHIAGAATTQVKSGRGILHKIVLNKPVASATITLVDNTSGTTPVIGLITNTTDVKPYELIFDARFSTGLRIITSGADDVTVVYQ